MFLHFGGAQTGGLILYSKYFSFCTQSCFPLFFFLIHLYIFLMPSWPFSNLSSRTFGADTTLAVFLQAQHPTQWYQSGCQIWTGFGYFWSSHEKFGCHNHPQWLSLKLAFVVRKTIAIALYAEERKYLSLFPYPAYAWI